MKPQIRTSLVIAVGSVLLPLGLFAQANTNTSDLPSRQSQTQGAAWQGGQQFQRVSESQMNSRITADQLKGKKVVDRNGQKIGKVKHIGLTQALASGGHDQSLSGLDRTTGSGASNFNTNSGGNRQSTGATAGSTSPSSRSASSTPSTASASGSMSSSASSASTSSPTAYPSAGSASSLSSSAGAGGQARLLVELDNDVRGSGDDLVAIPISHAQFDKEKGEVKLQVSREDLVAQLR